MKGEDTSCDKINFSQMLVEEFLEQILTSSRLAGASVTTGTSSSTLCVVCSGSTSMPEPAPGFEEEEEEDTGI